MWRRVNERRRFDRSPVAAPDYDRLMSESTIAAAFFDFGGVITTSPFQAFATYERKTGLPEGAIREVNSTNPDDNAWARLERNELTAEEFTPVFEAEAASLGYKLDGAAVLRLLTGEIRPSMVEAIRRLGQAGYGLACLTNNFAAAETGKAAASRAEVLALFDHVVESSIVGVRKPEEAFYQHALTVASVSADQVVFLDDLGVNLKPARQMGMTTIKVVSLHQALLDLDRVVADVDLSELVGPGAPEVRS